MYSLDICRRIILSFAFLTFAFITFFSCLFNILNILSTVPPNHHHSSGSGSLWTHKNAVPSPLCLSVLETLMTPWASLRAVVSAPLGTNSLKGITQLQIIAKSGHRDVQQ